MSGIEGERQCSFSDSKLYRRRLKTSEMDSWINSDTDNLYVCHNLPFLDLLEMAIGKYGNVLFGKFLTYRQVMGF